MVVNRTCPIPVMRDTFPTSFMTLGFKLIPTRKSKSATPISENIAINSEDFIKFNAEGLAIIPVIIYPIIKGCLSSLQIPIMTIAIRMIKLSSVKIPTSIVTS